MTGARRFSLSSPDWGQAHLSLDAIVAYVDDELSPGAQVRAQAHLDGCGECRAEEEESKPVHEWTSPHWRSMRPLMWRVVLVVPFVLPGAASYPG